MVDCEERAALNGLEKKLFELVAKGATKTQWAEWLRAPLEHALADGDKELVMTLLKAGADGGAGWEGCDGRTLLGAAAEGGDPEMVSAILEAGGSDELNDESGRQGMTALHHAVAGGHTGAARMLMLAGTDVGLLDDRLRSVLHYAVEGGHLQLAENAIIGGADAQARDADGDAPLHLAAARYDHAFVGALLRRGASVIAPNKERKHPLHVAVEHGHIAVAEALLKGGADPNAFYDHKRSPLYLARCSLAMTRVLLKHGADANAAYSSGITALHSAMERGTAIGVVETLVEAGADIEAKCDRNYRAWGSLEGLTPLHIAAVLCNIKELRALLRKGANVNAVNSNGQTPLHVLCQRTSVKDDGSNMRWEECFARNLLWCGADETLTDDEGRTPSQLIKEATTTRQLQKLLANAPADRAWRRRGVLVMCRAFLEKTSTKGGKGRAGKAKARRGRGRGRGGGSAGGGRGRGDVLTRVVELEDDEVFQTIVGYL